MCKITFLAIIVTAFVSGILGFLLADYLSFWDNFANPRLPGGDYRKAPTSTEATGKVRHPAAPK